MPFEAMNDCVSRTYMDRFYSNESCGDPIIDERFIDWLERIGSRLSASSRHPTSSRIDLWIASPDPSQQLTPIVI